MSYVKIPFLSKSKDAEPLRRCIEVACSKTNVSQYTGVMLLTHILEELTTQVAMGRVVRLPGFGTFGPWKIENRASVARWGKGRSKPVFSPSRGFREEVRDAAPYSPDAKKKLIRHRKNHALGSGRSRSHHRVFTSMAALREQISAQIAGGLEDE